jgi:hypothetical protein
MSPPENEKRRPWQDSAFDKSKHHEEKQRYRISVETQACLSVLPPIAIGARQ